ncbi:hypothetical protein AAY473_025781 [Plecturocebus cupreus]
MISQAWRCMPVVPANQEAEVEGSPEPGRSRVHSPLKRGKLLRSLFCGVVALWEAEAGGSRSQEFETSLANMTHAVLKQPHKLLSRGVRALKRLGLASELSVYTSVLWKGLRELDRKAESDKTKRARHFGRPRRESLEPRSLRPARATWQNPTKNAIISQAWRHAAVVSASQDAEVGGSPEPWKLRLQVLLPVDCKTQHLVELKQQQLLLMESLPRAGPRVTFHGRSCLITMTVRCEVRDTLTSLKQNLRFQGRIKRGQEGQVWWLTPVIPALWEVELLGRLRHSKHLNPGDRGCSELRSHHCTLAWVKK